MLARIGICLACMTLASGCGAGAEASASGKVTLDGAPLDDATISFVPLAGGQRNAAWATVREGRYAIAASDGLGTGSFRVEIRALRASGGKTSDNDLPLPAREAVPGRYNSKSELVAEIKPGANKADFSLTSK